MGKRPAICYPSASSNSGVANVTVLYGIKNCDSVKKAKKWLEDNAIAYEFHDFRTAGIEALKVEGWIAEQGWQTVLNKRSTSWKQLDSAVRDAMDDSSALTAIINNPTLVKRPVLERGASVTFGFSPNSYSNLF